MLVCTHSSNITCASSICDLTPALPYPKLERTNDEGGGAGVSSPSFCFLGTGSSLKADLQIEDSDILKMTDFLATSEINASAPTRWFLALSAPTPKAISSQQLGQSSFQFVSGCQESALSCPGVAWDRQTICLGVRLLFGSCHNTPPQLDGFFPKTILNPAKNPKSKKVDLKVETSISFLQQLQRLHLCLLSRRLYPPPYALKGCRRC